MAIRKKAATGKGEKKQKSRKASLKDLDVKGIKGGSVKGGIWSGGTFKPIQPTNQD